MGLVSGRSDRFEETVDHLIIFRRKTELAGESAVNRRTFDNPQDEHFGNAGATIALVPALLCRTLPDGVVGQVTSAVAFWHSSVFSGDGTMPMPGTSILSAKRRRPKCRRKMRSFHCCCIDARWEHRGAIKSGAAEARSASSPMQAQHISSHRDD